tara:strand:+ start:130 stop:240 length:111 start_codon:yes stop_codon:yes gene_type:complete
MKTFRLDQTHAGIESCMIWDTIEEQQLSGAEKKERF